MWAPIPGFQGFWPFIALVTNLVVVRDLEVSVPPNFMFFRCPPFWTFPKKHLYTIISDFWSRIWLGDEDEMELNLDGQTWWHFQLPW